MLYIYLLLILYYHILLYLICSFYIGSTYTIRYIDDLKVYLYLSGMGNSKLLEDEFSKIKPVRILIKFLI